jgi:hypothetical protein
MAFKQTEKSTSGSLPFFSEWIKELNQENIEFFSEKLIAPKWIKAVTSGKGYMMNFDDEFALFVWKNSSIGSTIRRMISEEQGNILLLQFEITKKGLSFSLGVDDEVEVAVTEEKFEDDLYYQEITTENTIPIAPNDFRRSILNLPSLHESKPVKFTRTSSSKPKTK